MLTLNLTADAIRALYDALGDARDAATGEKRERYDALVTLFEDVGAASVGIPYNRLPVDAADGTTTPMSADLWVCSQGSLGGSYIARYSDEPSDYASTPADMIQQLIDDVARRGSHSSYSEAKIECARRARQAR